MQTFRLSAVLVGLSLFAVWASASAGACFARPSNGATPVMAKRPGAQTAGEGGGLTGIAVISRAARTAPVLPPMRRDLFRERERAAPTLAAPLPRPVEANPAPEPPIVPAGPRLVLAGIAEDRVDGRPVRTAIVSAAGDVWLVREGSVLVGRYRVERIAGDSVHLVDSTDGQARVLRLR